MSRARWMSVGALALAACGGSSDDATMHADASASFDSGDAPIAGFEMTLAKTKCDLGVDVALTNNPASTQWTGSLGLFVIEKSNQSSFCETDPNRPIVSPDAGVEDGLVVSYFEGAGMPLEQVGPLSHSYEMSAGGEELTETHVERVVGGVTVADSFAWASVVSGHSEGESVYWPALPASVRVELGELQAIVSEPAKLAAFQAKLPKGFLTGQIAIHHSCWTATVPGQPGAEVPLEAHATYDALIQGGGYLGAYISYLPDGTAWTPPSC